MQGSFGRITSPELLEPDLDVDRTTLSLAYNRPLARGNWQTTFAWGRNVPSHRESSSGYLVETAALWHDRNTLFARAETAEKDELFLESEPLAGQLFRVHKITIGYIRDLDLGAQFKFGVGVEGSKHFISQALDVVYGRDPSSYLVFVRAKL